MKKNLFLLISICSLFVLLSCSALATTENTKSTAEVLKLNKTSTVTFSPVYDDYWEDYDEYDFRYYYAFTPSKTAEYEFSVSSSEDFIDYTLWDNKNSTYVYDEYPVYAKKLTAGKTYYIELSDYVYDNPVWYKVIVKKHSHSFKVDTLDKATLEYSGFYSQECTTCGFCENATIPYIKTVKLQSSSYIYTGKTITPKITIKDSKGKTLKKDADYTLSGSPSAKNVGKYSLTVKFKGNYSASKKLTYKIVPKSTSVTSVSAITQGFSVKVKKQTVQTTGYQIQYSTSSKFSSPKLITSKDFSTLTKKVTGLKANTKYYVRVRTFKTINSTKFYSDWSESKSVKTLYKASIKFKKSAYTLIAGQKNVLLPDVVPSSAKVTFKSGNSSIVKIDSKGNITPLKAGTTTVSASIKYNGKTYTAKCKITVKNPSIVLNKSAVNIYTGYSTTIKATTSPSGKAVKWYTSNSSVASVSSGKITGKKAGTCTITASFTFGGKTYKATCKVTVRKYTPTRGEQNALQSAKSYLSFMAFSKEGLIDQLEYEGYTYSEAVYAVSNCGANWKSQAVRMAKSYLEFMSFSRQGLIDQLLFEGFTYEQAVYGVSQVY